MEALGTRSPSDAGEAAPVVAAASRRSRIRARLGVVLLLLGLAVAAVPGLAAGNAFLPRLWFRVGSVTTPLPLVQVKSTGATAAPVLTSSGNVIVSPRLRVVATEAGAIYVITGWPSAPTSLADLVLHEPGWTAAAIALLTMVPFYAWWRRCGLSFGRIAGVATCIASAAEVCVLVLVPAPDPPVDWRVWWTVPLGAALMGAAFVVAPAPRRALDD